MPPLGTVLASRLSSSFRKPRLLDGGVSKRTWDFEKQEGIIMSPGQMS